MAVEGEEVFFSERLYDYDGKKCRYFFYNDVTIRMRTEGSPIPLTTLANLSQIPTVATINPPSDPLDPAVVAITPWYHLPSPPITAHGTLVLQDTKTKQDSLSLSLSFQLLR